MVSSSAGVCDCTKKERKDKSEFSGSLGLYCDSHQWKVQGRSISFRHNLIQVHTWCQIWFSPFLASAFLQVAFGLGYSSHEKVKMSHSTLRVKSQHLSNPSGKKASFPSSSRRRKMCQEAENNWGPRDTLKEAETQVNFHLKFDMQTSQENLPTNVSSIFWSFYCR